MRGYTILELMFVVVLSVALLGILAEVMSSGARILDTTSRHLDAIHSAQFVVECLQNDLNHLILSRTDDPSLFAGTGGWSLEFHVTRLGPGGDDLVYFGDRVAYRALPEPDGSFRLTRNGDRVSDLRFLEVGFQPIIQDSLDGSRKLHLVKIRLRALSPLQLPDPNPRRDRSFTVEGLTAVDTITEWRANPDINPNPSDAHPILAVQ